MERFGWGKRVYTPSIRRAKKFIPAKIVYKYPRSHITMMNRTALIRVFYAACLGILLGLTFRLFSFSYFWLDDFNNLYWVQKLGGTTLLWDIVNPISDRFRPVGWFAYWVLWSLFGLAPTPYHVLAWIIHGLNVFLVYILLQRMARSDYAAAFGSLLFVFQAVYWDIYWSFGTIFELLAAFFFLLGVWIYLRQHDSIGSIIVATLIYILAIKAKEMAITLPAIWFMYEVVVKQGWKRSTADSSIEEPRGSHLYLKRLAIRFSMPILTSIWFVYLKTSTMAGMITSAPYSPDFPYYMNYDPRNLAIGFGWYLDALAGFHLHWAGWAGIAVVCAGVFLVLREGMPLFFLSYIFICLLPVLVFPNHRVAFFWYIPFFGVSGLAAWGLKRLIGWIPTEIPPLPLKVAGALLFLAACYLQFHWQVARAETGIQWAMGVSEEYRSFLEGVKSLPQPRQNETVYYSAAPSYFDDATILTATQVAFRRTDIKAQVLPVFPTEAAYRVRYERGAVRVEKPVSSGTPSNLP